MHFFPNTLKCFVIFETMEDYFCLKLYSIQSENCHFFVNISSKCSVHWYVLLSTGSGITLETMMYLKILRCV